MMYQHWLKHFEGNKNHFDHIDWVHMDWLDEHEKKAITTSLQQFQRGENSEGKNLIRHARASGLPDYLDTIIQFIKEEQRHAKVLGKYMTFNGIDFIYDHWVDTIFRKLRNLAGLEHSVVVLITAEIIAAVYYKALLHATGSQTLKKICEQILIDEEMHIRFQSYTLHQFYRRRNWFQQFTIRMAHLVLMIGTIGVVWWCHHTVLKMGGFTLVRFYNAVFEEFNKADRMITGTEEITIDALEKISIACVD